MTSPTLNKSVVIEVLDRDILYIKGLVPWWGELIDLANKVGGWARSTEVVPSAGAQVTAKRVSHSIRIDGQEEPRLSEMERRVFNAVSFALRSYFDHNQYFVITQDDGYSLLRYDVGHFYSEHVDYVLSTDATPYRTLSVLVYLNDNYKGGEIVFRRQGITIKPEAGSVVVFPSTCTHPHEALKVTEGEKYVVVTWAR